MKRSDEHPSLFESGSVVFDLQSTEKFDAIREIIHRAPVFADSEGLNLERFINRVIEREKLQSTGFGHGVAVAHGRTSDVQDPVIALGISRDGIAYEAIDNMPVHLLFIVANHPDKQMDYLKILSTLVSLVRDDSFRDELLCCPDSEDARRLLYTEFTSRLPFFDPATSH